MKARFVFLPVVVFGVLSIVGACSSDSGSSSGGPAAGGAAAGGDNAAPGGAPESTGAHPGGGAPATSAGAPGAGGEPATGTGGVPAVEGGAPAGGAAAGGAGGATDLCASLDLNCPNDNNPCTEDACNPATGTCGIPRTGTTCDDNIYCNGTDLCEAGVCTSHSGNPCATHTCDEPAKSCQCATKDDCSPDQPGDWSECTYASECATSGTQSRPVTKYTCNVSTGKCDGTLAIENRACTRVTQDLPCASDNLRCDGTETCKNGTCTSSKINPCTGNAAGNFCSESAAECGACSGNAVQGAYPGCSSGEYCCYNQATANAWACQTASCKLIVVSTKSFVTSFVSSFAAADAPL